MLVRVLVDAALSLSSSVELHRKLGEESSGELGRYVVSTSEGKSLHWESHPSLPEKWVMQSSFGLEGSDSMGSECTNSRAKEGLGSYESLVLIQLGSIGS